MSRKGEYALRTIFHLSIRGELCTTSEIAEVQGIPQPFLKKIINSLIIAGFIGSTRGQSGGLKLLKSPDQISVKAVIEGVEGNIFLNDCLLCEGTCPRDQICPLHEMWQKGQAMLLEFLDRQMFDKLVQRHNELIQKVNSKGGNHRPEVLALLKLTAVRNGTAQHFNSALTLDTSNDS